MNGPSWRMFLNDREVCTLANTEEVVEIPLLLPGWQAEALEHVAHDQGLTTAAMLRHLLGEYLARFSAH